MSYSNKSKTFQRETNQNNKDKKIKMTIVDIFDRDLAKLELQLIELY